MPNEGAPNRAIMGEESLMDEVTGILRLANTHRTNDAPDASMLHCRRALEAIVHHLWIGKYGEDPPREMYLAEKMVKLERCSRYFSVNRIASSWIHWSPKSPHDREIAKREIGKCIEHLNIIMKEVVGRVPSIDSSEYTMLDAWNRLLSDSGRTVLANGGE